MSFYSFCLRQTIFTAAVLVFICGSRISDMSFEELQNASFELGCNYGRVLTAENLYGLPKVSENGFECSPAVIRVSNMLDIEFDTSRPQILISGEIHGDERVGPLASLITAQLLVWSARCVIEKNIIFCEKLDSLGTNIGDSISLEQRKWLAFLATRRDTIIVPAANCVGHKFKKRSERSLDPNRDFGYSRRDNRCFLSTTARIFHEIMKRNAIQIVVTFHGGMVALGYEWGSRNHPSPRDQSPDELPHKDIALLMKDLAGGFRNEKPYPVGRINSLIYPVDGGMEDWLYAAGWDKSLVQTNCAGLAKSENYIGYFKESQSQLKLRRRLNERRTTVFNHGNRALVFLVETSDAKSPPKDTLGGYAKLLDSSSQENGHVPRNVRLSLTAVDMVEPYTCFRTIQAHHRAHKKPRQLQVDSASNIMANSLKRKDDSSREDRRIEMGDVLIDLEWYVGGAHIVDETFLVLYDSEPTKDLLFNSSILSPGHSFPLLVSPIMEGKSRWFGNDSQESSATEMSIIKSYFRHTLDLSNSSLWSGRYWIVAWSAVDKGYGASGQGYPETVSPQSYFSNIRTNPNFICDKLEPQSDIKTPRTCRGKRYWASDFVEIEVSHLEKTISIVAATKDCAWWESNKLVSVFGKTIASHDSSIQSKDVREAVEESISFITFETKYIMLFVGALIIISLVSMVASYWRRLRIYTTLANNPYLNLPTGFQRI